MDRFSAYLLVRRFLRRPASRNQALAVEATMEAFARHAGHPAPTWGLLGLLSQLDLEYAATNPEARGRAASEQAELEGLTTEQTDSLARWCRLDLTPPPTALEHALFLADHLATSALARSAAPWHFADDLAPALARQLQLEHQSGTPAGDRLEAALLQLSLAPDAAAGLVLQGLRQAAGDLR